jgi:5,10-methylenetetrahydrofolate reductase
MKLSTEKTPKQKLSKFSVDNVSAVNITHLSINDLKEVAQASDELNQQAGCNKAVPHVAARNIQSEQELDNFIKFCEAKGINKALVIGGSIPRNKTNVFQNDVAVATILKSANITVDCGIYPQNETELEIKTKLSIFNNAITQLCMDENAINRLPLLDTIRIGVPSMCSVKGIYKYLKLCGNDSYKYIFKNYKALNYLDNNGIRVDKFIQKLKFSNYHIYNFGKLDKTIYKLLL